MPSDARITLDLNSLDDTDRLGRVLAKCLPAGTTVALEGTLGAGKTRLVQALAAGLGINPQDVISPTFVLYQRHEGRLTLHHYDVYRLGDEDQFLELGPEEAFYSPGLTLVEWGDKFPRCLPPEHLVIRLEPISAIARRCEISGSSSQLRPAIVAIEQAWRDTAVNPSVSPSPPPRPARRE